MKEKPNYYAIIPAEVRYDKNLRDKAKLLYGEITALSMKDGYCYASNKYFAELYNITPTNVSLLIKELIDNGYIERTIVYKEGTKEILNRYLKIFKGGYLKNIKEGIKENLKDNNTSNNNTSNNNNNNVENDIPYDEIVYYLNTKINSNYRSSSKQTRRLIKARYNEGYTIDDFKKVIDIKCKEWLNNVQMEIYLRPETLFGTKFESYLNQKNKKQNHEMRTLTMEEIKKYECQ